MNHANLLCYSHSKEFLENVLNESQNCFTKKTNVLALDDQKKLIDHLKIASDKDQIQLVLIDIEDAENSAVSFIEKIEQIVPNAVKLILSESVHLLKIQQQLIDSGSMHYLNRNCSSDDFRIALKTSESYHSNLQIALKNKAKIIEQTDDAITDPIKSLANSDRSKVKLFSIIAHDLKSPFNGLLGISDILVNNWEELSDCEKLDLIKASKSSSEKTFRLLEDLLAWIKSQDDSIKTNRTKFKVSDVIENSLRLVEINSVPKNIELHNEVCNQIELFADRNMLAAIFRNLITNSIKYIPPGSTIRISSKSNVDFYTFCVSDNGDGVHQQFIIDYFSQAENRFKRSSNKFRGLGLLLCKDFVERHNGKMWLDTKKGEGTKFYFTIPREQF